jgi:hypothetical protein
VIKYCFLVRVFLFVFAILITVTLTDIHDFWNENHVENWHCNEKTQTLPEARFEISLWEKIKVFLTHSPDCPYQPEWQRETSLQNEIEQPSEYRNCVQHLIFLYGYLKFESRGSSHIIL